MLKIDFISVELKFFFNLFQYGFTSIGVSVMLHNLKHSSGIALSNTNIIIKILLKVPKNGVFKQTNKYRLLPNI